MKKLTEGLSFKTVKHVSKTMDVQPSGNGGLLVIVTGDIYVDDSKNALKYCEVFQLKKERNLQFFLYSSKRLLFRNRMEALSRQLQFSWKSEGVGITGTSSLSV